MTIRQSGMALVVTLFMLCLLTVIGVSAVMLSTTHFRLVGNLQAEKDAEMAMQIMVEDFISVPVGGHADAFFNPDNPTTLIDPPAQSITVNGQSIAVDITRPRCIGYVETSCTGTTCSTLWEFQAVASGAASGVCLAYRWGVSAPMMPQLCIPGPEPPATPCP